MTSSLKLFLILYYIKQIDSKLPCICSVIDHRGRQNVVRTSVTHSAVPCVPLFCSYHILMSSVIYYWTDAQKLGIYLLNMHIQSLLHSWLISPPPPALVRIRCLSTNQMQNLNQSQLGNLNFPTLQGDCLFYSGFSLGNGDVNPLSPNSDQHLISPNNITTWSNV